jgi:hypothetical protein
LLASGETTAEQRAGRNALVAIIWRVLFLRKSRFCIELIARAGFNDFFVILPFGELLAEMDYGALCRPPHPRS